MLNSAEHEICHPNDILILKLLTVANSFLLNIDEDEHFSANKYENTNYCSHFHTYSQRKFHAQLSWAWKMFHDLDARKLLSIVNSLIL